MNLIEQINSRRYIFLTEISEPEENSLRLVIEEGRLDEQITDKDLEKAANEIDETINSIVLGSFSIVTDENCFLYEISFETYIAYSIRNESFCEWNNYEEFSGDCSEFIPNLDF